MLQNQEADDLSEREDGFKSASSGTMWSLTPLTVSSGAEV